MVVLILPTGVSTDLLVVGPIFWLVGRQGLHLSHFYYSMGCIAALSSSILRTNPRSVRTWLRRRFWRLDRALSMLLTLSPSPRPGWLKRPPLVVFLMAPSFAAQHKLLEVGTPPCLTTLYSPYRSTCTDQFKFDAFPLMVHFIPEVTSFPYPLNALGTDHLVFSIESPVLPPTTRWSDHNLFFCGKWLVGGQGRVGSFFIIIIFWHLRWAFWRLVCQMHTMIRWLDAMPSLT